MTSSFNDQPLFSIFFEGRSREEGLLSNQMLRTIVELDELYSPCSWNSKLWEGIDSIGNGYVLSFLHLNELILGFSLLKVVKIDCFAHLLKIIILPEYRSKGFGTGLLEKTISVMISDGYRNFFLEVETGNLSAITLYKKHGFDIVRNVKHFYTNGNDAFVMSFHGS